MAKSECESGGFGKAFERTFTGSMAGSGAMVFAVWFWVIANQRPVTGEDGHTEMYVEINPKVLAAMIGESREDVAAVVKKLCEADPESRSPEERGARLVKEGSFLYRVVNGMKYRETRDRDKRNAYMREYMRQRRTAPARKAVVKKAMSGGYKGSLAEKLAAAAEKEGDMETAQRMEGMLSQESKQQAQFREDFYRTLDFVAAEEAAQLAASVSPEGGKGVSDGSVTPGVPEVPEGAEHPPRGPEGPIQDGEEAPLGPGVVLPPGLKLPGPPGV